MLPLCGLIHSRETIMARKNTGPRYFDSKQGYFCTINGERHCLAKGPEDDPEVKEAAERKYHELMLNAPGGLDGDRATCEEILARYIAAVRNHRKPSTLDIWQRIYDAFNLELGNIKARDLKLYMVTAWLTKMEEDRPHPTHGTTRWNSGTRFIAITALKAAFNWAVEQEILSRNPIAKLKKPRARSRGGDQLLNAADHEKLSKRAQARLKDFILAMHETGARPGEVAKVTAADFHPDIGAWVLSDHKTERLGRKRVIYLTPRLVDLTRHLAEKYPAGPLFRNRCGRPWSLKTLDMAFLRLRKQLGLKRVSPYSYRHLFATEFLLKGGSMAVLAELLGDTVAMIEHHYGHLREHGQQLRQFLIRFRDGQVAG
jgi:integrase